MARLLRVELVVPVLALAVAAVALWQALAAQSRAELMAHDLEVAQARLRAYAIAPPATSPPVAAAPSTAETPLPPLPLPQPAFGGSPAR